MDSTDAALSTLELFRRYVGALQARPDLQRQTNSELIREVEERLSQLAFLLQNIAHAEALVSQVVMAQATSSDGQSEYHNARAEQDRYNFFVMRLLTESFYYFAFRVREILRNAVHPFPHLDSFEAVGVRQVRNHLIEHPEKRDSRVFSQTFSFTPGSGMHLKTWRAEHEPRHYPDAGLRANAHEFFSNLAGALNRALAALAEGGSNEAQQSDGADRDG